MISVCGGHLLPATCEQTAFALRVRLFTSGTFRAETYLGSQKQPAKKPKKMIGVFSIPLENSHSFQFYHLFSHSLPHYFLRDLRMYLRFCEMRILKIEAKKFKTFVRE